MIRTKYGDMNGRSEAALAAQQREANTQARRWLDAELAKLLANDRRIEPWLGANRIAAMMARTELTAESRGQHDVTVAVSGRSLWRGRTERVR